MKTFILACLLGFIGATAHAEPCYYEAMTAAKKALTEQGLKQHSIHFDSIEPVHKDQREVNYDIKLFYWITLKNGDASSSANTKNFYVRMQTGNCRLIEAPQASN